MDLDYLLAEHIDLRATLTLLGAVERGYTYHAQARDGFADPRLSIVAAGHMRNRKIDDVLVADFENRVPGSKVEVRPITGSPNKLVLIKLGLFILTPGRCRTVPHYSHLPNASKSRLKMARESIIQPQQRSLWDNASTGLNEKSQVEEDEYVFCVLSHHEDGPDKSKLGRLDLVIVDQHYKIVQVYDLHSRSRQLAAVEAPINLEKVRLQRRGTKG